MRKTEEEWDGTQSTMSNGGRWGGLDLSFRIMLMNKGSEYSALAITATPGETPLCCSYSEFSVIECYDRA